MNSEFYNFEINTAKGLAYVQAPEQLIGGRETLDLTKLFADLTHNVHSFVIELSKVHVINSSGLGTLILAHRTLSEREIKLFLMNPSDKVKEIIKITHLDKIFSIISDLSEI
ncbi:MAG: hypothetical protein A2X64_08380 [Ignavibacteria bacterium GWF2_33_9]|nr:MAG: hypothetical protein A2X64_08380 [Ignavibacteria bacterium GWF2_33_9]